MDSHPSPAYVLNLDYLGRQVLGGRLFDAKKMVVLSAFQPVAEWDVCAQYFPVCVRLGGVGRTYIDHALFKIVLAVMWTLAQDEEVLAEEAPWIQALAAGMERRGATTNTWRADTVRTFFKSMATRLDLGWMFYDDADEGPDFFQDMGERIATMTTADG